MTDASGTVIASVIAGVASIIVALITVLWTRGKKSGDGGVSISNTKITARDNAFIMAGDLHVQYLEERFISRNGGRLIIAVSKEVIPNEVLRQEWSSFDAKFLKECVKDTPRGEIFDGETFQAYRRPQNDEMFSLGVKVYTACCKRINDESDSDYAAFNRIAQIYLSARMVLRQD